MHIIIIGAGLGGLTATFALSRLHTVSSITLLESRAGLSQQGSGINTRPGASRILRSWGLDPDMQRISDSTPHVELRDLETGYVARSTMENVSTVPDYGTLRTKLMEMWYEKVKKLEEEGKVVVKFGCKVDRVLDDDGSGSNSGTGKVGVVLEDGEVLRADLVLAADGIRSRIRSQILRDLKEGEGLDIEPRVSDITFYGVVISRHQMSSNKLAAEKLLSDNALRVYMGQRAFVVARHNRTLRTWGGLFGIQGESSSEQKGLWDENGDIEWVRNWYRKNGTCEELMGALEVAESCDRWKLVEMPNLPRWRSRSGRIVLLGDSAHGMHPNAAQGYSMIVEDIGVLEYLINEFSVDAAERIPETTRLWETIRKPRVERIKEYAKWNTSMFIGVPVLLGKGKSKTVSRDLRNAKGDMNSSFGTSAFVKWSLDYDAVEEAKKYMQGSKARL